MRIIGGKYGGRKLVAFKGSHIRPTTDRVKEVIFNKLQWSIEDSRVLDLFSGTGNLAIESLSRGAESVVAVEMSGQSMQVIKKNISMIGIGDELQTVQMDVLRYLKQPQENPFDIILVDPPFTKKMAHEVLEALSQSEAFGEQSEVFIESTSQEKVEDKYGSMVLKKRQSYGDKFLSHYIFG